MEFIHKNHTVNDLLYAQLFFFLKEIYAKQCSREQKFKSHFKNIVLQCALAIVLQAFTVNKTMTGPKLSVTPQLQTHAVCATLLLQCMYHIA
uniref:Uncharacterized protein n=1 Tax=Anguilla anguilla TaxID=7936 RepID=A0A0E9WX78_ANGAN